jgi:hypothetical protein
VHGLGFESFTFGGQWWCRSMVLGSNLRLFAVIGGVVHGRGFESLLFWGLMM